MRSRYTGLWVHDGTPFRTRGEEDVILVQIELGKTRQTKGVWLYESEAQVFEGVVEATIQYHHPEFFQKLFRAIEARTRYREGPLKNFAAG